MIFSGPIKYLLLVIGLLAILAACTQESQQQNTETITNMAIPEPAPQITITRQIHFPNIPSASGLELASDGSIYIISDDSPYLYHLDADFKLIETTLLFETDLFETGRIPKMLKPDLESLTTITIDDTTYLLTLGSGALPNRDSCYLIPLPVNSKDPKVQAVSLQSFYRYLSKSPDMAKAGHLNLEGVAINGKMAYLMHRFSAGGSNKIIAVNLDHFKNLVSKKTFRQPHLKFYTIKLDKIDNTEAGFSGAAVADGKLFFTASVEKTPGVVEDGSVAGSFAGWINLSEMAGPKSNQAEPKAPVAHTGQILWPDGQPYIGKVESICIMPRRTNGAYQALAVTDNDQGQSELLVLEFKL